MIATFFSKRRLGGAVLAASLLAGAPVFAQQAAAPAADAAAPADAKVAYPSDAILYEASGRKWTVAEFVDEVFLYPPSPLGTLDIADFDLSQATPDAVREGVMQAAVQREAARRAREEGLELEAQRRERADRDLEMVEQRAWLFETGILGATEVTDEQVRAQYDADVEKSYTTPEQLALRHIFVGTYENYVVKPGDSLESIAESVSGDKAAAERILDPATRESRAEQVTGPDGTKLPPKALVEGEALMVPMNEEKAAEVGKRIQEAYDKLAAGGAFEEVAKEYGENPDPGRVLNLRPRKGEKPILAEMRAAFDGIADGEFSKPFRTKHGWQIVQRQSYKPQTVAPFESVRDNIRRNLVNKEREERFAKRRAALFAEYKDLVVDMDVLAHAGEEARKEDIIVQVDDVKYTAGLFARDFDGKFTAETPVEERYKLLAGVLAVQNRLMKWDKERMNIRETARYKQGAQRVEDVHLANRWLRNALDMAKIEPTEEQLLAKFEEVKKMLRKEATAETWQITVKADVPEDATPDDLSKAIAAATESLKAELAKVTTREEFVALAKQMSEDELAKTDGFANYRPKEYLGGMVGRALDAKVSHGVFGPEDFPDGRVVAIWIGNVDKGQEATLDDYRDQTASHVVREMEDKKTEEMIEQTRKDIGLVVHIPPVAK